jgi:hypothetical protein
VREELLELWPGSTISIEVKGVLNSRLDFNGKNSDNSTATKDLTLLWFILRAYTLLCGLLAARIAGASFTNVWERWDAVYYVRIVTSGYSADDGTTNFHPLYPLLAWPIAQVTSSPILTLLLVSSIATVALYLLFDRFAQLDLPANRAKTATLLLIFWPISYVLYLPYTESTWLCFAVLCLICARRGRWWAAGICASAATLTRQQGLFLIIPIAWELWEANGRSLKNIVKAWRYWLALVLPVLAYALWIIVRSAALGSFRPDSTTFGTLIYSTLLSPASHRVVEGQQFMWPWKAMYLAIQRALSVPFINPWIDLTFGGIFLLLVVLAWRHMRMSYRIYVVVIVLVSFSYHTGMVATGGAYLSLPRHLLLAFPVFVGVGSRLQLRINPLVMILLSLVMTVMLFGYFWLRLVP